MNGVEVSHAARGGVMIQGRVNMSQIVETGNRGGSARGDPGKEKTENRTGVSPSASWRSKGLLVHAPRAQMPRVKMRRMRTRVKDRMCLKA